MKLDISLAEANNIVYNLETQFNLLQYQVDGWSVWPLLRWDFVHALTQQVYKQAPASWRVKSLFRILAQDLFGISTVKKAENLIVTKDVNLRDASNGRYKDIFFDDLIMHLGNYNKIDTLHNPAFLPMREQAVYKSQFSLTWFRKIHQIIPGRLFTPPAIYQVAVQLDKIFSGVIDHPEFKAPKLFELFKNFYISKTLYTWLLKRISPKDLFLINAHGYHSLIAAAKSLDIRVVELQHGYLDHNHPGYSWHQNALPYKKNMAIPDLLFLYGDYWKDALLELGFWKEELCAVGNPRLDPILTQSSTKAPSPIIRMVVTTQHVFEPSEYNNFFQKFLDLTNNDTPCQIILKLHPGERSKREYEELLPDQRVTILLNHEGPSTFELIKNADYHLSVYSTCHYESLALGTPTIILPFLLHESVLPLLDKGYGTLCKSPEHLVEIIKNKNYTRVSEQISHYFFKPDAINNMIKALTLPS